MKPNPEVSGERAKLLIQIVLIMKRITLLVASIFLVVSVAKASEVTTKSGEVRRSDYSFNESISFTERGILFFVFPNGEFDFNTRPEDNEGDYFYKTAERRGPEVQTRELVNYGTRIEHDVFGRVRRIGNTFINYDNSDRVSRIGSVYMRYNRFALTQIGGMQIIYNRRGDIVDTIGSIKGYGGYTYNNNHYYDDNDSYTTSNNNNTDNYYYKNDGRKAKIENEKERR